MNTDPGATAASSPGQAPPVHGGRTFITNVLWNWVGAISTIAAGLLLQPYIIKQLGTTRYGIWALVFSTLDYLRLFDLGFRAAIVNYAARYRTRSDHDNLNNLLSTATAYFGGLAAAIVVFSLAFAPVFPVLFKVPDEYRSDSIYLVAIVGASLAITLFSAIFTGLLEAFQRFDLANHAYTAALFVRMSCSVLLLYLGYGLVELGVLALVCQVGERIWNFQSAHHVFPQMQLRLSRASMTTLRSMTGYSVSSFLMNNFMLISGQSPLVLLGYFLSAASVGFFSLPYRLVMYIGDIVPRVGNVAASKVAELDERGRTADVHAMTVLLNRYCYTLFLPLAIFLLIFAYELLARLVPPDFAAQSAVVMPLITIVVTITIAGMFNTMAALIGQGKHGPYARALLAEVVVYVAALVWSIPRYGVAGAAWSTLCVLTVSRGLLPAWILCRQNGESLTAFLSAIYLAPTLTALPAAAVGLLLKSTWLPGRTWPELVAAGGTIALVYFSIAIFTCLSPEHRHALPRLVEQRLLRRTA